MSFVAQTAILFSLADPLGALRASTDAEIHAIGIYRPQDYAVVSKSIRDWARVRDMLLSDRRDYVFARVWGGLDDAERARLEGVGAKEIVSDFRNPTVLDSRAAILRALSAALEDKKLYDRQAHRGLKLSAGLQRELQEISSASIVRASIINRRFVSEAYPGMFEAPADSYRVTRVELKSDRPSILVLSSSETCLWDISVKGKGVLQAVILCGYKTQDIRGVMCPVAFFTRFDRDGMLWGGHGKYVHAYKDGDAKFVTFVDRVRQATGRGLDSFQGVNTPDGTFTVPNR